MLDLREFTNPKNSFLEEQRTTAFEDWLYGDEELLEDGLLN